MSREAGVDHFGFSALGIVDGQLPPGTIDGSELRRDDTRSGFAECGIVRRANARGVPEPSLPVEHRVVHSRVAVPYGFVTPELRRLQRLGLAGSIRIAIRNGNARNRVPRGVEHRKIVTALLG